MANNTGTTAIKTEFINVVTEGELLSSPISATFSTIVTETFPLIKTPPIEGQLNKKSITTLYDKVFIDAISYRAFTENKLTYLPEGTSSCDKKLKLMYPKLLKPNYAKDCINLHTFISSKCPFLPPNLKHPHHKICPLVDTVSNTCDQKNPWGVTNVTASLTSSGTVSYMFAHYVDKDSLDMPRRTVPIDTTMMDYEDISISKELKLVIITENVKTPTSFIYLSQNQRVRLCNFFLFLFPFSYQHQYVPYPFCSSIQIYSSHFHTGTHHYSHFQTVLFPSYFDKTSYFVFTWCWLLHFATRSPIWSTLAIFPKFTTFPGNSHPWRETTNWTSSLTSYTIWYSQKRPLQPFPHPSIPWFPQT